MKQTAPTTYERSETARGYQLIAGVDEVGRGCWAGPVVAAAVILRPEVIAVPALLAGLTDSKQLTPRQRETLSHQIRYHASGVGLGATPAWLIDHIGIVGATRLAMEQAVLGLQQLPDVLLIDAITLPALRLPQRSIIHGDQNSLSIAAASVIAKTMRDSYMRSFDRHYPHAFGRHKGYGTTIHRHAIEQFGVTPLHRMTFRPVYELSQGAIDVRTD